MVKLSMVLAFAHDRPDGDIAERLEASVRLTPDGQLDRVAYMTDPNSWTVTRIRPDTGASEFAIVPVETGWGLRSASDEDEPLYAISCRLLRPGEIVTLQGIGGPELVFRVVNVETD